MDDDDFEDDGEEFEIEIVASAVSAPFSWWGLASDASKMIGAIFSAIGTFAFETSCNLGQAHNLSVDQRDGEEFARDVMKRVQEL